MMRVVLYAHDFEPITIIDLPHWAIQHLRKHATVYIPVVVPLPASAVSGPYAQHNHYRVRIEAEEIRRHGFGSSMLLFTHDERAALMLRAAFLPGQQSSVNRIREDAFVRGFIDALSSLGQ
jgi:hypothetical protein